MRRRHLLLQERVAAPTELLLDCDSLTMHAPRAVRNYAWTLPKTDATAVIYAASRRMSTFVVQLVEANYPKDVRAMRAAAKNGDTRLLQWMVEHEFPRDGRAIAYAARRGHLEIVQWMVEHEFPRDARAIAYATKGGHVDVATWLETNGSP